jgi:nucleotide-binding universal stress UspA family protein
MTDAGPLLVGYDGREESEVALDRALAEARRRGMRLVVLVVMGLPVDVVDPATPAGIGIGVFPEMTPDGPRDVQPIMAAARRKLASSGIEGHVEWTFGDPASEIVRVADELDAAAIVVGTHHHSALGRLLGTDIAASVVGQAHRDVVVVR